MTIFLNQYENGNIRFLDWGKEVANFDSDYSLEIATEIVCLHVQDSKDLCDQLQEKIDSRKALVWMSKNK